MRIWSGIHKLVNDCCEIKETTLVHLLDDPLEAATLSWKKPRALSAAGEDEHRGRGRGRLGLSPESARSGCTRGL